MKYLRKFNESEETDKLYHEIVGGREEFESEEHAYADLSKSEALYELFEDQEGVVPKIVYYGEDREKKALDLEIDREGSVIKGVEIFELDDEWYVVMFDKDDGDDRWERWYKCDQYDGLMQLLNDKSVIR